MIGRGVEREALAQLLAPDGGGPLILRGAAGIGKTTLVEWALERAGELGIETVRIAGVEDAAGSPGAVVGVLGDRFPEAFAELPALARATLAATLGEGEGEPPDRLALGVALTAALGLAAERTPLLLAVDDAQWLERESLEPLLFAARRLGGEPVALLISTRPAAPAPLLAPDLPVIELGGLGEDEGAALVEELAPGAAATVAAALAETAAGGPLAIAELVRSLSPAQLAGRQPLPDSLGAASASTPFRGRIEALPAATRRALALAAAEASGRAEVIAAALRALGLGPADLQPAEDAGLIERSGATIAFAHPLCRAAAGSGVEAAERRAGHAALAAAHAEIGDEVGEAEHRGRAASGPDEAVAALLERAAGLARRRAAPSRAARLALRAAEISPGDAERVRRTLLAAWPLADTEHGALAVAAIEAALPLAGSEERTELVRALAHAQRRLGRFDRAHAVALAEAERIAGERPAAAGRLLLTASPRHIVAGTYDRELAEAERALALGERGGDPDLARQASLVTAHAMAVRGEVAGARRLLRAREEELDSLPLGPVSELASYPADAALWAGRPELAARALRRPIAASRAAGDVAALIYPLTVRARLRLRLGEPRVAEGDAEEALRLATDAAQTGLRALALGVLAQVQAVTGPAAACRANATAAIEQAGEAEALSLYPRAALGRLELALGEAEAALAPLLWCERFALRAGIGNPEVAASAADLVEALAASGRRAEAEPVIERLADAAEWSAWAAAVLPRCRALLAAEDAEAVELLRAAIAACGEEHPLEAARSRLLLGRRLRGVGDRHAAAAELREAVARLRRLGATLWADRAAAELPPGERPEEDGSAAELTALEAQIARLAVAGLSNPEIGDRLFYSRKTVERHLSRVFAKLGVRSRVELARLLGGG